MGWNFNNLTFGVHVQPWQLSLPGKCTVMLSEPNFLVLALPQETPDRPMDMPELNRKLHIWLRVSDLGPRHLLIRMAANCTMSGCAIFAVDTLKSQKQTTSFPENEQD